MPSTCVGSMSKKSQTESSEAVDEDTGPPSVPSTAGGEGGMASASNPAAAGSPAPSTVGRVGGTTPRVGHGRPGPPWTPAPMSIIDGQRKRLSLLVSASGRPGNRSS